MQNVHVRRQGRAARQSVSLNSAALTRWIFVVLYLTVDDFGQRYKRSSFSVFFTMFEPVALISIIFVARWLSTGTLDWNDAVFHATGILPFFLFMHISQRVRGADTLPPIPNVSWHERILAMIFAEVAGKSIVGVIIFTVLYWLGAQTAIPAHPTSLILPCVSLSMLGLGVGLFNSTVAIFAPSWLYIYAIVMRVLMLASGITVRPDMMPASARAITLNNPLFYGLTWFREGFYASYPHFSEPTFLMLCACLSVLIGGSMHAITRAYD